jgi:transcription initiation factor IIE alpha subunit
MTTRTITAECNNCESSYDIQYEEELVSEELPELCPFCGEPIEELSESEYIEDDNSDIDDDEWTN